MPDAELLQHPGTFYRLEADEADEIESCLLASPGAGAVITGC
jgi:hypothetical protein